jgi:chorismate-pyruvate lyase
VLFKQGRTKDAGAVAETQQLVERHFGMQAERPADLEEIAIDDLDPFLRSLLFTDGTVTRALAVQALAPVAVSRLGQVPTVLPADLAACLEAEPGDESVRRQVSIGLAGSRTPILWAESHIVPERLPPGFMGLLDGAPDGIGQSLQRVALESYRELLWFGLDTAPDWAVAAPAEISVVQRLYRVISNGLPAILIAESFAVEWRAGAYHLNGLEGGGG